MKHLGAILFTVLMLYFLGLVLGLSSGKPTDFSDYFRASQRIQKQESLYKFDVAKDLQSQVKTWEDAFRPENAAKLQELTTETATYIYPPLFATLLLPLAGLPEATAGGLHALGNWFSLLGIFFLLHKFFPFSSTSSSFFSPWLLSSFVLLVNFRFLESHFQNNQVGLFLVFLVLLSVTRTSALLSGAILSLATVIKVTPAVFCLYFLYKRKFWTLFWFAIGLVFWMGLPLLVQYDYMLVSTKEWFDTVLKEAISNPVLRAWKNNQSLPATLGKYVVPNVDFLNQMKYGLPFVSWGLSELKRIQLGFLVVFTIPLVLLFFQKQKEGVILGLLFLFSGIFSGISWVHSFVICLFPTYFVISQWNDKKFTIGSKIFLGIVFLLPLLSHRSICGKGMESFFLMYSILLYSSSLLYFFIFYQNRKSI